MHPELVSRPVVEDVLDLVDFHPEHVSHLVQRVLVEGLKADAHMDPAELAVARPNLKATHIDMVPEASGIPC